MRAARKRGRLGEASLAELHGNGSPSGSYWGMVLFLLELINGVYIEVSTFYFDVIEKKNMSNKRGKYFGKILENYILFVEVLVVFYRFVRFILVIFI